MRNLVIGTAGHVDHGKTSLIKALTGINTDTLEEEQRRGISINLGFAYLKLDEETTVGIVDVPGHERFIKNMLAGVCGIDLNLLTVAADDGIMPQTREHMEIIRFLKVKQIICVITKTDLVSRERVEEVKQAVRDEFNIQDFVEFSIYDPLATEKVKQLIKKRLQDIEIDENEVYRMPIDRVFTVKGQGVVITGSALSGKVKMGDELEILPTKQRVRIRGIQSFNQPRNEAYKHMRVALNLGGVKKEDISRGKIIASIGAYTTPTKVIDVKIIMGKNVSEPLDTLEHVKFFYLASVIKCQVKLLGVKTLEANEVAYAQLLLEDEIYAKKGDLGVLRRLNPIETIAGVEIINAHGEYINKQKEQAYLSMLRLYDEADSKEMVLHYLEGHPFTEIEVLKEKFNLTNIDFLNDCLIYEERYVLTQGSFNRLNEKILEILASFHAQNPLVPGMNKNISQEQLGLNQLPKRIYNQLLSQFAGITVTNEYVKRTEFSIAYSPEEQRQIEAIQNYLDQFMFQPPKLEELLANVKGNKVKNLYYTLIKTKEIIQIDTDIVLTKKMYQEMVKRVEDFFTTKQLLTIQDLRDLLNTSRKYVVAYLEYLDKVGITKRAPEGRMKK